MRRKNAGAVAAGWVGLGFLAACGVETDTGLAAGPPEEATSSGVYALVLGSAQDAGLPQLGCFQDCCEAARRDPNLRRYASSVLIVDGRSGKRWLLDCTPHIEEQVALAAGHGTPQAGKVQGGRAPLFEGVFLTHAHLGHYAGVLAFGPEAYSASGQTVWATERMQGFLLSNDPFAFLVERGALQLAEIVPGVVVELAPGITLETMLVPHRDELSDTAAFVVRGPERSLLYLPDIDKWERWERRIEEVVEGVDVALLDGTFFADGEVPGRAMSEIAHPFVLESLERLRGCEGIWFTHLNHTNPAHEVGGNAERRVQEAGMGVAREGMVFGL